ncbi:MAG: DUF3800 domain-containing protein [Rhodoplanes sp.]
MAFFRAFTDDSASDAGDRRLFLAGYLNRAEWWAVFADTWAQELRAEPAIDYLKMVEAQNLRDQFRGWDPQVRDEKLRGLARVIRHFEPLSFQVSVSREFYSRVVAPVSPYGIATPYYPCCEATMAVLANFAAESKMEGQIEFIFDEQDRISDDIQRFFEKSTGQLPRKARRKIAGPPLFRNDKQFLPLQAADMLAWHIRREHESGKTLPLASVVRSKFHIEAEIPESLMTRWAKHHERIPELKLLQTKAQWRAFRHNSDKLTALGIDPSSFGRPFYKRAWDKIVDLFR